MTLGEKLVQLRTARGLSQGDLAERLEVSRQSVSKWETSQSTPDLDKIIRLADLYGVTVDELVREGERPQPPEPEAKVVYVERERKQTLTEVQILGIVAEAAGAGTAVIGLMGEEGLVLVGTVLVILGLPLLLAKKHPWLICSGVTAVLSWVMLTPWISIALVLIWAAWWNRRGGKKDG